MSPTFETSIADTMVFDTKRSPLQSDLLATGDSSGNLKIWNMNMNPISSSGSELSFFHGCDVLTVHWHRLNTNLILSGGSDGLIRLWDLRNYLQPIKRYNLFCCMFVCLDWWQMIQVIVQNIHQQKIHAHFRIQLFTKETNLLKVFLSDEFALLTTSHFSVQFRRFFQF